MNVICLEEQALYDLTDKLVSYVKAKHLIKEDKWISDEEAMKKLRITSKTTLQKYRDEGKIRYSTLSKKSFLYDTDSINEFIEKNTKDTF